jgi:hypothetical protein
MITDLFALLPVTTTWEGFSIADANFHNSIRTSTKVLNLQQMFPFLAQKGFRGRRLQHKRVHNQGTVQLRKTHNACNVNL